MTLALPLIIPLLGALGHLVFGWNRVTMWIGAASSVVLLVMAVALAVVVVDSGPVDAWAGFLWLDPVSAFMLLVIAAVAALTTASTPTHFRTEITEHRATAHTAARHGVLVQLFVATMNLTVLAANLGVLWVSVEATTIVTAFLIGQSRTRAAVEAAWKYVVICSAGIALALLGVLLVNYASAGAFGDEGAGLNLAALSAGAHDLDPDVMRIAVVLLILGFGTKAGLAPLHAWLPDAHSQAPAPVSALMSGVLLSVAFYGILRVQVISDAALGVGFARTLLVIMALASLLVATTLLLTQRDYKRMLAYSSIEHLGLVALGAAIGTPLALSAALLHILGHGLVKSVLFLGTGRIRQITRTSRIDEVRGFMGRAPVLAICAGVGVLALIGLPPFSVFASELGIARAGLADPNLRWATGAALLLVLGIAATLFRHISRMLLGTPADAPGTATAPVRVDSTVVLLVVGLVVSAILGISAVPLSSLLDMTTETLIGGA